MYMSAENNSIQKYETCSLFLSRNRDMSGSLWEREMLWENKLQTSVSTPFSTFPKLSEVLSIQTLRTFSILLENTATIKRTTTCSLWLPFQCKFSLLVPSLLYIYIYLYVWIFENGAKAETHDATNRGDTSRRQVVSSALQLRQGLSLTWSLGYVARIQTSLNSCDRMQRQNSVAATMIFICHTRRFVAATCRGDLSQRFVASCVLAFKELKSLIIKIIIIKNL